MIKEYDPNKQYDSQIVSITLMRMDYVGHVSQTVRGDERGSVLLSTGWWGVYATEDVSDILVNDCNLRYHVDGDFFTLTLTNGAGDQLRINADADELNKMVVAVEISAAHEKA